MVETQPGGCRGSPLMDDQTDDGPEIRNSQTCEYGEEGHEERALGLGKGEDDIQERPGEFIICSGVSDRARTGQGRAS